MPWSLTLRRHPNPSLEPPPPPTPLESYRCVTGRTSYFGAEQTPISVCILNLGLPPVPRPGQFGGGPVLSQDAVSPHSVGLWTMVFLRIVNDYPRWAPHRQWQQHQKSRKQYAVLFGQSYCFCMTLQHILQEDDGSQQQFVDSSTVSQTLRQPRLIPDKSYSQPQQLNPQRQQIHPSLSQPEEPQVIQNWTKQHHVLVWTRPGHILSNPRASKGAKWGSQGAWDAGSLYAIAPSPHSAPILKDTAATGLQVLH